MSYPLQECKGDIADAEWQFWCRLCSKDDVRNINILPEGNHQATASSSSLIDFIAEFFKIHIAQNEVLPHWLCAQCFSLITTLSKYTSQVKKVQNMYYEMQKASNRESIDLKAFREKYNLLDDDLFSFNLLDTKSTIENIFVPDVTLENMIKNEIVADEVQSGIFFENLELKNEFQDPIGDALESQCNEMDRINVDNDRDKVVETNSEECDRPNSDTKEDKYFCSDCNMNFPNSVDYLSHMDKKHGNDLYTCPQCSKTFKSGNHLKRHKRAHHIPSVAKHKKHKTLKRAEEDTKKPNYTCSECSMGFQRSSNYTIHMRKSHGVVKTDEPQLPCPQCSKIFKSNFELNRHIRTHSSLAERRIYSCPQCEQKFQTKDYVTTHIKFVHENIRPFICEECGESVRTESALREHMLTHTNDAPFICEVCERGFKNQSRLKKHMEIHSGNKYTCNQCGLQLKSRATLNRHMLVHSDVMRHKCDYCGREFKRAKTLKAHLILHSGLKPYSCDFCDRTFANGSNCRTHKKKAHPEELAAQEAFGGKPCTKNIPKLAVLKAVTSSTENLLPVPKQPRPQAEPQPQPQAQPQPQDLFLRQEFNQRLFTPQ